MLYDGRELLGLVWLVFCYVLLLDLGVRYEKEIAPGLAN